jgi:hypothetical protein
MKIEKFVEILVDLIEIFMLKNNKLNKPIENAYHKIIFQNIFIFLC